MAASCMACGASEQPDGARFCHQCGSALAVACRQCGAGLVASSRFCSSCGAAQENPATTDSIPLPQVGIQSERRVTSVLFCDLVGYTSLSEGRDHEEVRELLTRYFDDARQVVQRYGGTIEKFIGDAVMAVWGVPTAHEDDAERAVRAGLELTSVVRAAGEDLGVEGLAARVGIVTAEVAVSIGARQQGMVAGDAVNTASRVQTVAAPGEVWVDETTRLLTSGAILYADAGSHVLKGKADPVPLWTARAVVAARGGAQRADGLEAPHLGRGRELRLVKELFHSTEESRRPALLLVEGEAGVGKSRLAWEFEKYIDGLTGTMRWHTGRCRAYGEGSAFPALAEAVRGRLTASGADPDAESGALLEAAFEEYAVGTDERDWLRPRLEVLLGTGTQQFAKEDLFAAWTTFFERIGENANPVLLLIDDAQYSDEGLLDFIEHLISWATFPMFVMVMARPGLLERRPTLATHRRSTVIHLTPLDDSDMAALLDGLVSGLPDPTRVTLVSRAEGIPLYAVETVRSLIDRDLVVPRGGVYVLSTSTPLDLESVAAPPSLQALVSARLDALHPVHRRVVNVASVLGTTMSREQLAALTPDVTGLDAALAALVHAQILEHQSSRLSADYGHYRFVQSVVRQVAYGTLSRRDRKAIHLGVIGLYDAEADSAGEQASQVAQHHLDAIEAVPGDDDVPTLTAAAISLLRRAAVRSRSMGLPKDAATHLGTALAHVADPRTSAELQSALCRVLGDAGEYATATAVGRQAVDAFEDLGDDLGAGDAAAALALALNSSGDSEAARAVAEPRWEALKDRPDAQQALLGLSKVIISARSGLGVDEADILERRVRLVESLHDPTEMADTLMGLSVRYQTIGAPIIGRILMDAGAGIAREHQLTTALARALINMTADDTVQDGRAALIHGREALQVARRTGVSTWQSFAEINYALALWLNAEWSECDRVLRESEHLWLDVNRSAASTVLAMNAYARGTSYEFPWAPGDGVQATHLADRGWLELAEAMRARHGGDLTGALVRARQSLGLIQRYSGYWDDYSIVWAVTSDIALELGDAAAMTQLLEATEEIGAVLPVSLQAHRHRIMGLLASRDGGPECEPLLRESIRLYDAWGCLPLRARVEGELGGWLQTQGRSQDAGPLVESARAVLQSIGAARWLAELDQHSPAPSVTKA